MDYKSLAEMDLPPVGENNNAYWASFEYENGMVGTWANCAQSADEFVESLLRRGEIKRIDEIEQWVEGWPEKKNLEIPAAKYNRSLGARKRRKGYGPHKVSFEAEQAYRRGFYQALALVTALLENGASAGQIREWENNVLQWRNSLTEDAKSVTTPDMFMPQSLGGLIYSNYKPRLLQKKE